MPIKPGPGRRLGIVLLALLAGCAGKPPINAVSNADMAVNQAMAVQAQDYAPEDLQRAMDKVARAKQAMADEHYDRAWRLAEEAQADAQVAEAKARSEAAQRTVRETRETMESLRREAQIRSPGAGDSQGGTGDVNP